MTQTEELALFRNDHREWMRRHIAPMWRDELAAAQGAKKKAIWDGLSLQVKNALRDLKAAA